ncbi:MFS transporter [Geodermatophilus sp. CPCC 205506]|uniref:MFS transporter n=1 Tax=Geodermatophilus sp. CPCC 205506 TaxID=2936596 RepID=UPI003EE8F542
MIFVVGVDLRLSLGALPTLMADIEDELRLSAFSQGLATSLAIACMGLAAPVGPRLGRLLGHDRAMSALLVLLAVSVALRRWIDGTGTLLASVALAGIAMGAGSSVIPALISQHVSRHRGTVAGVFTTGTALGVALAGGTALPLADWLGGWREALAFPALAIAGTVVGWEILSRRSAASARRGVVGGTAPGENPWVTSRGWLVTIYAATPMLIGFTALAWIAPFYAAEGWPAGRAAALFVVFQLAQFVTMLSLPAVLDRRDDKRPVLLAPLILILAGVGCLMAASALPPELAVALLGLGVGGATALGLAMVSAVSATHVDAGRLGSMVFTVGFALSTIGPAGLGALKDATGSFHIGFACLAGSAVIALAVVACLPPSRTAATRGTGQRRSAATVRG